MIFAILGSYWKAKNVTEMSRILQIARKYDIAIALILYERDKGRISFDYAEQVIEQLRCQAEQEMAEVR